jgi:hypothetical protein
MKRFTLSNLPLSDLKLINRQSIDQSRGFLPNHFFPKKSPQLSGAKVWPK